MIRLASFFSGIGGLELGLEAALGAETVFQCERDRYAVAVLARHWPGVQRHDDITQLRGTDIPAADVWCGGFPCQDISLAGKGAGLDGERSGLWWQWLRLVREVGPRIIVVENVAAFAVRGLDAVLGALADCGYDAEWSRLSAAGVGAPHLRQRLFIIAWRNASHALGHALRVEPVAEQRGGNRAEPGHDGQAGLVADTAGHGRQERAGQDGQPIQGCLAQGGMDAVGEGEALADAVRVNQPEEQEGHDAFVGEREARRRRELQPPGAGASCRVVPGLHAEGTRGGENDASDRAHGEQSLAHSDGRGQQEREEQHGAPNEAATVGVEGRAHVDGRGDDPAHGAMGESGGPGLAKRRGSEGQRAHETVARAGWWTAEPDVGRVANGVSSRVDRLRCLGNAVVPRCGYVVGLRLREIMHGLGDAP